MSWIKLTKKIGVCMMNVKFELWQLYLFFTSCWFVIFCCLDYFVRANFKLKDKFLFSLYSSMSVSTISSVIIAIFALIVRT